MEEVNHVIENSKPSSRGGVNLIDLIVPIGIVLEFAKDVDPNTIYKGTTWIKYAEGRVTVGKNTADQHFAVVGNMGGVKTLELQAMIGAVNCDINTIGYLACNASKNPFANSNERPTYTVRGTVSNATSWNHTTVVRDSLQKCNTTFIMNPYVVVNKWTRIK